MPTAMTGRSSAIANISALVTLSGLLCLCPGNSQIRGRVFAVPGARLIESHKRGRFGLRAQFELANSRAVSRVCVSADANDKRTRELKKLTVPALTIAAGIAGGAILTILLTRFTAGFEKLGHAITRLMAGRSQSVVAALGFAVGALHTLAGPDHLAGLAPLVVGQRRSTLTAFALGALWGSGHATGQLLIGLAILAVNFGVLHDSWAVGLGDTSAVVVGVSLMLLGILGIVEVFRYSAGDQAVEYGTTKKKGSKRATYMTGVLHGLSPDAILFFAPALALPRLAAVIHVIGVVTGTLLSMGCVTAVLGALSKQVRRLELISACASSLALTLGTSIFPASLGIRWAPFGILI
eukprot:TRINITY_DN12953_c0_g2_i1.p1 TRINITY_DN12953_c0_g2~~TRINITY_DN12953_c0_g2_i1.p1  ORF type:complete len:352 (-),score=39.34 TRINITY_DN12953_c0_g2_i1:24-1079(-)